MSKAKQPAVSGPPGYIRQTVKAAVEYTARRDRLNHPSGGCDSGGRWYPDESEHRWCCSHIRQPSRGWPWSLMLHCRTAEHVAEVFDVDATDLKRVARLLKAGAAEADVCESLIAAQQQSVAG